MLCSKLEGGEGAALLTVRSIAASGARNKETAITQATPSGVGTLLEDALLRSCGCEQWPGFAEPSWWQGMGPFPQGATRQ